MNLCQIPESRSACSLGEKKKCERAGRSRSNPIVEVAVFLAVTPGSSRSSRRPAAHGPIDGCHGCHPQGPRRAPPPPPRHDVEAGEVPRPRGLGGRPDPPPPRPAGRDGPALRREPLPAAGQPPDPVGRGEGPLFQGAPGAGASDDVRGEGAGHGQGVRPPPGGEAPLLRREAQVAGGLGPRGGATGEGAKVSPPLSLSPSLPLSLHTHTHTFSLSLSHAHTNAYTRHARAFSPSLPPSPAV